MMSKRPFDKEAAKAKVETLRKTVDDFASSILSDTSGDIAFAKACDLARLPHPYSFGNLFLITLQAGDSALVASKTAFDKMAAEQGHAAVEFKNYDGTKRWKQHVRLAKGCSSITILAPCTFVKDKENDSGETVKVPVHFFRGVGIFRAEDVLYCDTLQPFEVPTLLGSVDAAEAPALMASLLKFAEAKKIAVNRTAGLQAGNDGLSYGGFIEVRGGDTAAAVHPLIHELAHELLHPRSSRGAELSKKLAESEAEATASTVLRALGYDTALSSAYLRHHKVTPADVKQSLDRIVGAAQEILVWLREGRIIHEEPVEDSGEIEVALVA